MAELIVKEIVNPFRQEIKTTKVELDLYSKLIKPKKPLNDNTDLFKDLYSQLLDNNEKNINVK